MSMTDPLADMLTRIRNAALRRKASVDAPASNLHEAVARILIEEGYIRDYRRLEDNKQGMLTIYLKYGENREPVIVGLKRVSSPGRRVYASARKMPRVLNGLGSAIVSTSQGVLTGRECARRGVGGEVLCYVW